MSKRKLVSQENGYSPRKRQKLNSNSNGNHNMNGMNNKNESNKENESMDDENEILSHRSVEIRSEMKNNHNNQNSQQNALSNQSMKKRKNIGDNHNNKPPPNIMNTSNVFRKRYLELQEIMNQNMLKFADTIIETDGSYLEHKEIMTKMYCIQEVNKHGFLNTD